MLFLKVKPIHSRKAQGYCSSSSSSTQAKQKSIFWLCLLPLYIFGFGVGLLGCANSAPFGLSGLSMSNIGMNITKISDISQNSTIDSVVHLQGQVTNRAPLMGLSAYQLKDTTGTIWVFTNQTLPNLGDEVLIQGKLQFQSIPVSGKEFGEVYIVEEQVLQRKAGQPGQPVPSEESLEP